MSFPSDRPRRLRRTDAMRRLVRETDVLPRHLVQPLFLEHGHGVRRAIASLNGQERLSPDMAVEEAKRCFELGIPAVLLFGVPRAKNAAGTEAWDDMGIVQDSVRAIKAAVPGLLVIADLCLCEYTSHGHCGVLDHGCVLNDPTLEVYERVVESYARAGVDIVAPSGMMDGTVKSLRKALDESGHPEIAIMAYAVKYASAFYGPFRSAAESAPAEGNRLAYQMDPANAREAIREASLDDAEGADILMVKPAGSYLDIVAAVRARTTKPVAAYQVSGEYAMIMAAAKAGLIDGHAAMWESVRGIRRAGADIVITYFARELAREYSSKGTT